MYQDYKLSKEEINMSKIMPADTLVRAHCIIKPGGINDDSKGWYKDWATKGQFTDSVYLNCEFKIQKAFVPQNVGNQITYQETDDYNGRKLWHLIGLYSAKGPKWAEMGASFFKKMIYCIRNIHPDDIEKIGGQSLSPRNMTDPFADIHDRVVALKTKVEDQGSADNERNGVHYPLMPNHTMYQKVMGNAVNQEKNKPVFDDDIPF